MYGRTLTNDFRTSYEMDKEDWSRVLAGNELLHAFQFYPDQWKKLESTTLSALLEATQPGVSTNAIPHADETKTDQAKQAGQDKQEGQTSQGATTDQAGQAPQVPSTGGASPPAQPTAVPGATANVTSALAFDPLVPMPRSPTPRKCGSRLENAADRSPGAARSRYRQDRWVRCWSFPSVPADMEQCGIGIYDADSTRHVDHCLLVTEYRCFHQEHGNQV